MNSRRRSSPARMLILLVTALALAPSLLAACGSDEGIRISAVTSTPPAATPTPVADDAETVDLEQQREPVPLPNVPENPFAGGRLVEAYLAGGDANMDECLPELVNAWNLAPSVEGVRCAALDLDGDRRDEWVFLISFGQGADDDSPYPADLWFFQDEGQDFRFFNSARALANAPASGLQIREIADFTNDGIPDVVMTWRDCGAHTCVTRLLIASHHNGALENLAPTEAAIESLEEFAVEGTTIRMAGGLIGSVGAGPQRPSTTIVRWAGARFRAEIEQGDATYLVHLVNDADRLFAAGSYQEARDAYDAVIADTSLADWRQEQGRGPGRTELRAYATFRSAIAAIRLGAPEDGINRLVQTIERYQGSMHDRAAQAYLVAYVDTNSEQQACAATEAAVDAIRAQYVSFWDYGYSNPERTVFTLCR